MNYEQNETVGDRIRQITKLIGISQDALAQSIGITRPAISKWVSGETTPTAEHLYALEDKYGFLARWVLQGKGPKTINELHETIAAYEIEKRTKSLELIDVSNLSINARRALDQTRHAFEYASDQQTEKTNTA